MGKVKIQLTPYNAMAIISFLREFVNDDLTDDTKFTALRTAVDEYQNELTNNITPEQMEDANAENQIHRLMGTSPDN